MMPATAKAHLTTRRRRSSLSFPAAATGGPAAAASAMVPAPAPPPPPYNRSNPASRRTSGGGELRVAETEWLAGSPPLPGAAWRKLERPQLRFWLYGTTACLFSAAPSWLPAVQNRTPAGAALEKNTTFYSDDPGLDQNYLLHP
jgi:hypothetical protein